MPSWSLPPAPSAPPVPSGGDPASAVEDAVNTVVDGAGQVVDAVTDAVQNNSSDPTTPAAPTGVPIPYPNLSGLGAALQGFGDFAQQSVRDLTGTAQTSIGAAAGIVSETLARTLPLVISVLDAAIDVGGVGARVSSLVGRVASSVDELIAVLTKRAGEAHDGGQAAAADAANGLRELGFMLMRDAQWQKRHLRVVTTQLSAKPRPRRIKVAAVALNTSDADAARVRRMLMRLSLLGEKLRRLETQLAQRGPLRAADARAVASLRASLQTVQRGASGPLRLPPRP